MLVCGNSDGGGNCVTFISQFIHELLPPSSTYERWGLRHGERGNLPVRWDSGGFNSESGG
jgi:hypothetical protein